MSRYSKAKCSANQVRPSTWMINLAGILCLAGLIGLAAPIQAHERASAQQTQVVEVEDLGPMLLVGEDSRSSVRSYASRLVRKGVFTEHRSKIHQWSRKMTEQVSPGTDLRTLRQQGGPLIGIQLNAIDSVVGHWGLKKNARALAYSVKEAGGTPVFLPPATSSRNIDTLLAKLDHLILSGGADIHPSLYKQKVTYALELELKRDLYEQKLISCAITRGLGLDGICRGMQNLNVALGGTLSQDLKKDRVTDQPHGNTLHEVRLVPRSRIARTLGMTTIITVASRHHQAINKVAPALRVVGTSPDGVIEAVEGFGGRVRGYQFHPEIESDHASKAIFRDMVARAAKKALHRTRPRRLNQRVDQR